MRKHTKVVATIGPTSESFSSMKRLYKEGMDVARLNFSHGSHEYFHTAVDRLRRVSGNIALMMDTKGPEIRAGLVEGDAILVSVDQKIQLTKQELVSDGKKLTGNYRHLEELKVGNKVLIDDGLIEAKVSSITKEGPVIKVLNGGELGSRKTVSVQGHSIKVPFLSKKDKEDIMFGINNNLDFVAASFVRNVDDVRTLRRFLDKYHSKMKIISKVEHWESIHNIDEILDASDGIMIARGDLGVEASLEKVPKLQFDIIKRCNILGKPVIVATQMLESMRKNPRPTRAEVSDVAHAILQGADAVMLSGETASGKYPIESVKMMTTIAKEYDPAVSNAFEKRKIKEKCDPNSIALFVTRSAYRASKEMDISAILTPTETGFTARMVARFRPRCPILAATPDLSVFRQLQLSWGVYPMLDTKRHTNIRMMTERLVKLGAKKGIVKRNDLVVVTAGSKISQSGKTNLLEVYKASTILKK